MASLEIPILSLVVRTSSDDDLELSREEGSPGESRLDSGLRLR